MLCSVVAVMSPAQASYENASTQAYLRLGLVAPPSRLFEERMASRPEPKCPVHQVDRPAVLGDAMAVPKRFGLFDRPYGP